MFCPTKCNGISHSDGTFSYGYDAENRLTSASGAGNSASYAYDAQGRRKSKTVNGATTLFVTDADNREVLAYDGSTGAILNWYAYGLGPNDVLNQMNVAAGTRATLIPDIQGSVIASLDSGSGALTTRGYLPYGASASTTGSFAYTGQRVDPETNGLHYYRARMYMPAWGRFMQVDPIGYGGGSNLYTYVGNDPLNHLDPLGLAPGDSYPNADAAAIAAMHDIYSQSVQQNVEFAGRVYQTWFGFGSYSYTAPNRGTVASSIPGGVPWFTSSSGYYHSHGGPDPQYDSEHFSPQDLGLADSMRQPGYVVTPSGIYQKYDPATQQTRTILQTNPPGTPIPDAPNYPTAQAPDMRQSPADTGSSGVPQRGPASDGSIASK